MTNGLYGRCIHDLNPTDCDWCKQNQKLRELLEKTIEELTTQFRWSEKHRDYRVYQELKNLLEESKK